ncbi:unnamed protein product [Vicia faba]|uniref:Mitochondrial pyruvate carrier n=1 Tax=Vicia faba TaxID=3906 RepID=A0AAV0ZPM6_VICFA|nr:unnamed protein product [Vicia faba]CAI8609303.1 unnamed protein product [Vicia faba]CAI8609490.1 unnamed protein product [Vicia faba]
MYLRFIHSHGVLDNIATKDKLNTTAGSYALLGSVVPRDAGVVTKLRKAGAIILGKATLSEWSHYRSAAAPSGWSARGGQGKNPYTLGFPCGSSSGSAISVAANLVTVSLGTKTDGSILCPSNFNSVVGIKPTVGLTSRAGVVPISPRQDTIGPICRTVSDAAYVLETIAGIDTVDKATIEASKYIPKGGYAQFLKKDGLRGKRLGVVRLFYNFGNDTFMHETFKLRLKTLRQRGAVLVDNLKIDDIDDIIVAQSEIIALNFEFKLSLNAYLKDLIASPVKSLAVHFWAPTFKWGISIANIADFSKPPDMISYPQQIAVMATGLIWANYSTVITPCKQNFIVSLHYLHNFGL